MSWTSGIHTVDKTDLHTVEAPIVYDDALAKAQGDQWENVLLAAELLARAVGRPEDQVSISASGHSNPDHAPREGWGDEFISLTITARPAPEVVIEPDPPAAAVDAVPLEPGVVVAEQPPDEVPSA